MGTNARPGKTVGVYDRPAASRWPKLIAIAVALLVVVALAVALMGGARAAEPSLQRGQESGDVAGVALAQAEVRHGGERREGLRRADP